MRIKKSSFQRQKGFALAVVLLILLVLLVLGASVLFSTATNARITGNYRVANETFAVANAGLERVTDWFTNAYTPQPAPPATPYQVTPIGVKLSGQPVTLMGTPTTPGGSVPNSNFPSASTVQSFVRDFSQHQVIINGKEYGSYSVDARLLSIKTNLLPFGGSQSIERWQVEIKASEPRATPAAQISAIIEVGTPSYFNYAIKAEELIDINQDCLVDSYDSRLGAYGGSNISSEPANIGSNDRIDMSQNVLVKGDADYLNTLSLSQGATVAGSQRKINSRILFDDPTYTLPPLSLGSILVPIIPPLSPGRYDVIDLASTAVITLLGGTYYVNKLKLSQGAKILINPLTGPVKLYVAEETVLQQNADISTTLLGGPLKPTQLFLYTKKLNMKQNSKLSAAVYAYSTLAPDGEVVLQQDSQIFGSVASRKVKMSQNSQVHYDIALRDDFEQGNKFRLVYWTYKNFF